MPKLARRSWEEYAKLRAGGAKQADAYLGAGFTVNVKSGKEKDRRKDAQRRASALLSKYPEIRARVAELTDEIRNSTLKRSEINRQFVLDGLKENVDRSLQKKAVLDRDGNEVGEWKYEGSVANRAYEMMGKELGMFADRMIIGTLDGEIEGMTVDQVRSFIRAACSEVGLRVVDQSEEQTKEWIIANADRVGLVVTVKAKPEEDSPPKTKPKAPPLH